eukprot:UN02318
MNISQHEQKCKKIEMFYLNNYHVVKKIDQLEKNHKNEINQLKTVISDIEEKNKEIEMELLNLRKQTEEKKNGQREEWSRFLQDLKGKINDFEDNKFKMKRKIIDPEDNKLKIKHNKHPIKNISTL